MAKQKQKDRKTIKKGYFKKKSLKKPNIVKKPPEKKFEIQRGGGNDDVESKAINDLHGYVKWLNKYGDERAKLSIETTKDATGLWNCRCSVTIGDNEHRSLGKGLKTDAKKSACVEMLRTLFPEIDSLDDILVEIKSLKRKNTS